MKIVSQFFELLLVLAASNNHLSAQIRDDSVFVSGIVQKITRTYIEQLNTEAPIYNGKMYRPVFNLNDGGHTLFQSNQYTKGTIVYNGHIYQDVNLMYDMVKDQLVLLNFDQVGGIVIWPQYVDAFSLHQHTFINIRPDSTTQKSIAPGYYDLLYQGKTSLLAKRIKELIETPNQNAVKRTVSQQNKYYLLNHSGYTLIKGKKDLLRLLSRTRNENLQYIKTERLNFKKELERSMIKLLSYHDSIL
ncbi:hypothetical protein BDE36_3435 [Arcticibacter tournemirensis]|uniref:Uncharacterized protein n=1 Tax=Arcticibacter tournemirensis TaxID=699437 RepID=A0A4Q0M593_9SPHI|nr:hypothetical protein [Arcticibacter tournemirensis]KAA8482460.1 hypothetical protein F1649_12175 [Arcticibacter tournemirensis]RXF68178.1 hypothetical protein EKH83_16725 [Arcticibacter tournemirensis]TQM51652.1 hypothetical protein BDE36_3435 [Arcticibacter tournemirensis]